MNYTFTLRSVHVAAFLTWTAKSATGAVLYRHRDRMHIGEGILVYQRCAGMCKIPLKQLHIQQSTFVYRLLIPMEHDESPC